MENPKVIAMSGGGKCVFAFSPFPNNNISKTLSATLKRRKQKILQMKQFQNISKNLVDKFINLSMLTTEEDTK